MGSATLATLVAFSIIIAQANLVAANYKPGKRFAPWKSKGLKLGFYSKSCPGAENIVKKVMTKYVKSDTSLAASILRLHFHDCFVRGCDGSVLLNSTAKNTAEKDSPPNASLRGFFVIDGIKAAVEKVCPQTVSCADILALAARDGVVAIGGPSWDVPTGRRDGKESHELEARQNLPRPTFNLSTLVSNFKSKGLNRFDLVALSGCHTIGVAHCSSFVNRLYNFTRKGDADPLLDPTYVKQLKALCAPNDTITTVPMDRTNVRFDSDYFVGIRQKRGLFTSDAALLDNQITRSYVNDDAASVSLFSDQFKHSMVKMGLIQLISSIAGEVHKDCKFIN